MPIKAVSPQIIASEVVFRGGLKSAWGAARAEEGQAQLPPRLPAPHA